MSPAVLEVVPVDHPDVPKAARWLAETVGQGWTATLTLGAGLREVQRTEQDPDTGKGHRVLRLVPVRSLAVRLRGPGGRRAAAVWAKVEERAWASDGAWLDSYVTPVPVATVKKLVRGEEGS